MDSMVVDILFLPPPKTVNFQNLRQLLKIKRNKHAKGAPDNWENVFIAGMQPCAWEAFVEYWLIMNDMINNLW